MFDLARPVPTTVHARVSQGWGRPRPERLHRSLDISLPVGTPIHAVERGKVIGHRSYDGGDSGIWIGITHPSGLSTRYLHLERTYVKLGDTVRRGQQIGLSGNTGHSSGPHLHLDLHVPAALLPQVERHVGKPVGGYGAPLKEYGYFIAGEPWVPVDEYKDVVKIDAKKYDVPLYRRRAAGGLLSSPVVIGAAVAGAAIFFLR